MQKVNELKKNFDTLSLKFNEDKIIFGKSFISNHPIKKLPNDFGLYGMIGNAREWVNDLYDSSLGTFDLTDPIGNTGSSMVQKGGQGQPLNLRHAKREVAAPQNKGTSTGFRLMHP